MRAHSHATQLCCCSDQLSDPATCTPAVLSQLILVATQGHLHDRFTDDLYLDIVSH